MADVLFIEGCDFKDYPAGGQLSFAKQMMQVFGPRLSLVGFSTDDTPVGRWIMKNFDGIEYNFFAVKRVTLSNRKPFIPMRIKVYLNLKRYKKQILSIGIRSAFIQAPEILIAVHKWGWDHLCYLFPGVSNPLEMPRYTWGKLLARPYEKRMFLSLKYANIVLACADEKAIESLINRSDGILSYNKIEKFSTKVDTFTFKPIPKIQARKVLGIDKISPIIVCCGRINRVKGWDFVLEAFRVFLRNYPEAKLYFVGDGEDRSKLLCIVNKYNLEQSVFITGFQSQERIVYFINASDLCVIGSHKEGWSIAMLEALACGKPIVSTNVSGARDMIINGKNGFVVEERDFKQFAKAMIKALTLDEAEQVSLKLSEKYALKNLSKELGSLWKPLA